VLTDLTEWKDFLEVDLGSMWKDLESRRRGRVFIGI